MKMKYAVVLLVMTIFLVSCSGECTNGMYKKDGKCCTSVCELECANGYVEGSCKCECNPTGNPDTDSGVGDIFSDNPDLNPPSLPP